MSREDEYKKCLNIVADNLYGGGDTRPLSNILAQKLIDFIDYVLEGKDVDDYFQKNKETE